MPAKKSKPPSPKKRPQKKRSSKKQPSNKKFSNKQSKNQKKSWYKKANFITLFFILLISFFIYLFYLDQRITQRFEGRIWQLPAHVYARPLELYVGKDISKKQILFELNYLNYKKLQKLPKSAAQYRYWANIFEIKTRDFIFWDGVEKSRAFRVVIEDEKITQLVDIYSGNNIDLVRFDAGYLTGIFPSHSEDRVLLRLDDVPDMFIKMLLLIEDRRFFSHWGIDPLSIARALIANIYSGKTVQGGSTLTQQLVKNLFLTQDKTLARKLNEAFMSILLEFYYDKKLILETYFNEIYLGQDGRRAIHGFGLASEFYFGKPLKKLSLDEMAVLIGMVKGASYYNPERNPAHARERRNVVLNTMQQSALITERQLKKLSAKPIVTVKHARSGLYPAFIDLVKLQLQQNYQSDDLSSEGLRVFTTLDPYIQFKTEQAVIKTLPQLSKSADLQTAAVVVSPSNGDLLAVVGNRKPSFKGFNRALNAQRQIGSLIKPVIYLTALQHTSKNASNYTLATVLDDSKFIYKAPNQDDWQPLNYDKKYHGDVTLYKALLKSYNVPAVRIGLDVGLDNIIDTLSNLGYSQSVFAYPSLTLGAMTMSPFDVAGIYQTFAANGFHSPLRSVHAVLDKDQKPLERYSLEVDNQVNTEAVAIINSALIDVAKYGTAKRLAAELPLQVAGKTGTSDDLRDSWFAGFSGDMMAVVWTGFDDNRPSTLTGSSGAMKIWKNIISETAYKPYQVPEMLDLKKYWINEKKGLLSEEGCENAVELLFIEGSQPQQSSDCKNSGSNWFLDLFN
ncbi:Multimodular transpeptidase-transglycosylase [hydrothermal vent metagenome]|uniref:Penicillin-binding protein 1B n=1 Tax=hydrothermal vent metagenome TaxID=652676 RepID=A0A3B0WQ24_9ZZZZ